MIVAADKTALRKELRSRGLEGSSFVLRIPDGVKMVRKSAFCMANSRSNDCARGMVKVVIPDSVTRIGRWAFNHCSRLEQVAMSRSLKLISSEAFRCCTSLVDLDLPDSLSEIEDHAFSGCNALKRLVLPPSLTIVGNGAISSCKALEEINIPAALTNFGKTFLSHCTALKSIVVDENNPTYDSRKGCNAIIKTATNTLMWTCNHSSIPDSVKVIGEYAFYCSEITHITIPNSVWKIGNGAFAKCRELREIELPDNIKRIGKEAFAECSSLERIKLPKGLTKVSEGMLKRTVIEEIKIPESVKVIGRSAFSRCRQLAHVDLPESLIQIQGGAFLICPMLSTILIPRSVSEIHVMAFHPDTMEQIEVDPANPFYKWEAGRLVHIPTNSPVWPRECDLERRNAPQADDYDTPSTNVGHIIWLGYILNENKMALEDYMGDYNRNNIGCNVDAPIVINKANNYIRKEYCLAEGLLTEWTSRKRRFKLLSQRLLSVNGRKIDCLTYKVCAPDGKITTEEYYFDITVGYEAMEED